MKRMLTAVIVDDEPYSIITLEMMLQQYCNDKVKLLGSFSNPREAVDSIRKLKPQILFLDIEMPLLNGFDLLQRFPDHPFHIIFTTAYNQYAVKAIRFSALDYLLKPVDEELLMAAVEKAEKREEEGQLLQQYHHLVDNMRERAFNSIVLPGAKRKMFVKVEDIIRCEAESNYTNVFFTNKEQLMVSKPLKEFEELLIEFRFFRVHNSHLINLRHVHRYLSGDGGKVIMTDQSEVDVSRRKKEEFLQILSAHR